METTTTTTKTTTEEKARRRAEAQIAEAHRQRLARHNGDELAAIRETVATWST